MSGIDPLIAYRFIKQLSTPWKEWDAYKLGLIDAKGKRIRKASTGEEKKAFPLWKVLIRNLKRLLDKVPGAGSKFGSFAVALFLLKEEMGVESNVLEEEFEKYIDTLPIILNLSESEKKINILEKGRYVHRPTNDVIFLKEDSTAVDEVFNTPVFRITDSITKRTYTITNEDLEIF